MKVIGNSKMSKYISLYSVNLKDSKKENSFINTHTHILSSNIYVFCVFLIFQDFIIKKQMEKSKNYEIFQFIFEVFHA